MKNTNYKEFAVIYDELMNDIDYEKWTDFIVSNIGTNSRKVLEAACGTGSITCRLAPKGFNITSFDLSEQMLIIAYEKLRRMRNVRILNQDMRSFSINQKFDACICCCDGINYLTADEINRFFNRVNQHLVDKSRFIFDMSTDFKYNTMYNNSTYIYDDEKIFYAWENNLNMDEKKVDMEINFFVRDNNIYKRITETQTHYFYEVSKIKEMLELSGFDILGVYDDYSEKEYNNESLRAVFVCEKR